MNSTVAVSCPWHVLIVEKSVEISIEPSMLNKSGEWLTVGWSYVDKPSNLDWLGMWVLPDGTSDINAKTQAPVKYQVD